MYNTISEFMEQPEVKQFPGYDSFKRAVISMINGAEKETPLPPANCIELTEGVYQYDCPSCGWVNTVVTECHKDNMHYCRKCGRKVGA